MQVGVRELKTHLSRYLNEVQKGTTVTVTDRGKPVAALVPADSNQAGISPRLARMIASGRIAWSGEILDLPPPTIALTGSGPTVADIVIANRE